MISATAWVARSRAKRHPHRYAVDDDELARVSSLANVHFDDAKAQLEQAQRAAQEMGRRIHDEDRDKEWQDEEEDDDDDDDDDDDEGEDGDKKAQGAGMDEDKDELARYRLEDYDADEGATRGSLPAFDHIKGLQFYRNNDEDPYITLKDDAEDQDEEKQALEVLPSDNLVVAAKTEDEVSVLECYVYSRSDANLYVHHDVMLPAFPLCLEWLDFTPHNGAADVGADQNSSNAAGSRRVGERGNFIAVGTMDPEIEVWSMDVVEGLFPDAIYGSREQTQQIGQPKGTGKKKRKQLRGRVANPHHHVDAVLGLSWNRVARNLLASASADATVKLWDMSRPCSSGSSSVAGGAEPRQGGQAAVGGALRSFDAHEDKVQCVAWNTSGTASYASSSSASSDTGGGGGQPSMLLTGGYDGTLRTFDARAPQSVGVARVASDVESLRWNPWREHNFLAAFENGQVQSFDARLLPTSSTTANGAAAAATASLFTLAAHDGPCASLDVSASLPGCLVTGGGSDGLVKLWSVQEQDDVATDAAEEARRPKGISLVTSRDLGTGKVFTATFSPDDALTVAAAGSNGSLRIWDALTNAGARRTFGDRLAKRRVARRRAATTGGGDGGETDDDDDERMDSARTGVSSSDGVVGLADDDEDESDDDEADGGGGAKAGAAAAAMRLRGAVASRGAGRSTTKRGAGMSGRPNGAPAPRAGATGVRDADGDEAMG